MVPDWAGDLTLQGLWQVYQGKELFINLNRPFHLAIFGDGDGKVSKFQVEITAYEYAWTDALEDFPAASREGQITIHMKPSGDLSKGKVVQEHVPAYPQVYGQVEKVPGGQFDISESVAWNFQLVQSSAEDHSKITMELGVESKPVVSEMEVFQFDGLWHQAQRETLEAAATRKAKTALETEVFWNLLQQSAVEDGEIPRYAEVVAQGLQAGTMAYLKVLKVEAWRKFSDLKVVGDTEALARSVEGDHR